MKKRIFLALIILITFLSISIISASEISVNDTYVAQDSSENLLAVDAGSVGVNSSNILSIKNVDTNLDENTIGQDELSKQSVKIDAPDIELYYKNGTRFIAKLSDDQGNNLANQPLIFTISGINYTKTTDNQGYASIAINLIPGDYNLIVYYGGNEKYSDCKTTANCTVLPTIYGEDITKYYKNGTQYSATFLKGDGSPLANTDVSFNINGVFYTRTTNSAGVAGLNINLPPEYYILTAIHPDTGYTFSNNVTVLPTIYGEDITKYFKNGTQYSATFLKGDGSPLANTDVSFNINGVFYTRTTNSVGVAGLNINLPPENYILTATHPDSGYMYSNLITVLPTINGSDVVKVYRDSKQYSATFLKWDGSPLANTDVRFNINGVYYTRTTDGTGVARLNINLPAGEYILTAYHPDTYRVSNTIKVLASSTTTILTNDYVYNEDDKQVINATLLDELGYGVPNKEMIIYAGNSSTPVITDNDGTATLTVGLIPGIYKVEYTFAGDSTYKASSATSTLTINEGKLVYYTIGNTTIYYNKNETFDLTVCDEDGVPLVGEPVYFRINGGKLYERITDETGTAKLTIRLDPGIYVMSYVFNTTGYQHITDSCQFLVIDGPTSTLTGSNTTVGYGAGEKFNVFLNVDEIGLPNRDVIFTINGVNYTRSTGEDGIAGITINLLPGKYLIKYYYRGENRINPSSGEAYVTVKEKIPTSFTWESSTTFVDESEINLMVSLMDNKNNKPIPYKEVLFSIGTKTISATTDKNGLATITISLSKGNYLVSYEFKGDDDYLPEVGYTPITVTDSYSSNGYGYWSVSADMYSIDLANFANLGTKDILLNFYALELYGESAVLQWIANANSNGIRVHIWMQVFYNGDWVNPISGGKINQAYFDQVISQAKYYAGLKGVAGVHFDYLRYPGNAYQTSGGTAAITEFVRQACEACKQVNSNIIMSAAVMPETTDDIYYYGQDIPAISKYLDVIIPMQYKGNYHAGTSWLISTTNWFVQNSNGAQVWSGLQSYVSEDVPTKLSYEELFADAQTVMDAGADGVILFRYGLSQFLNFYDLDGSHYGEEVTVNDVLAATDNLKKYIESDWALPSKIAVGTSDYSIPQVLHLMSEAVLRVNGDIKNDTILTIKVSDPKDERTDDCYGELSSSNYVDISKTIRSYCLANSQAPGYVSSSIGDINYKALVYSYARILSYYREHKMLPADVLVTNFLNKPNLTVNMMPSSTHAHEYTYQNYTTTWLSYCPQCGYYGTLLDNPKHVSPEGEITCHYCDCDYCGVTGYEKDWGSDLRITNLTIPTPLTPGGVGDNISISSIVSGASYIASFYLDNQYYPDYVIVTEGKYTVPQFLYLMSKAIVQINSGNFNPVTLVAMEDPSSSGDTMDGYLTKDQYVDVYNRVANFIVSQGIVPAYASSALGNIPYLELVDASSRILDEYKSSSQLPSSIHVIYGGQPSGSVAEVANELVKGLTTDVAKATALFNFVRDYIAYEFYYDTQKGAQGTLDSGSGNCCDQSQLLVAMGRAVGLTTRFDTGYCYFPLSGSWYGHVWTQFLIDGSWINADPTSERNSFGVIVNWDTSTYEDRGTYDVLPY